MVIQRQRPNGTFWTDLWVIYDDETAHFVNNFLPWELAVMRNYE